MKVRTGLTIISVMAAIGGVATPVGAKSLWDQLNESAPRSIFDEIRDTAPRTIFDEIRDSAPVRAPDQDLVGE
jgi:hypothetical protein